MLARSLSLAVGKRDGHSVVITMRNLCIFLGVLGAAVTVSCETIPDRKAGGGAFDDSYLSRRLDSNNPDLSGNRDEKGKLAVPSYDQWRTED